MKLFPVELGRDGLGLGFELEIAGLELGLVALEALAIGLGGAQGLALGEQVVAGEAVLDVDDIAHLSEAPDALEQNDLHVRHSYPCHIVPLLLGGWRARAGAVAQIDERLGEADDGDDDGHPAQQQNADIDRRQQKRAERHAAAIDVDHREPLQHIGEQQRAGEPGREQARQPRQERRSKRAANTSSKALGSSSACRSGQGLSARPEASTISPAIHRLNSVMVSQMMAKAAGSARAIMAERLAMFSSVNSVPSRSSSFSALWLRISRIESR